MSINSYRPEELATARKAACIIKDDTDELTHVLSTKPSSHGIAAKENRDRRELIEIHRLEMATDESELEAMLNEL